jgi:hypothetical protein
MRSTRFVERPERDLPRSQRLGEPRDLRPCVKPRIVAHRAAARQLFDQPVLQLRLGPVDRREGVHVRLRADLHAIAAIDEKPHPVVQDRGEAGGAGEPGEPCQPLVRRRHVFPLEPVGARDEEHVHTLVTHLRAEVCDPGGTLIGRGLGVE